MDNQRTLGFVHQTAATSVAAAKAARPARSNREIAMENHLLMSGAAGMTRHQLADAMGIPLSSVCSLCRRLLDASRIAESGDTRPSPHGQAAKVIRHIQYRGRRDD